MTTPTPEAIEAAARAICAAQFPDVADAYAWNVQFEDGKEEYRAEATAALSAAYPFIAAQAKGEALREAADACAQDYETTDTRSVAKWLRARAATIAPDVTP